MSTALKCPNPSCPYLFDPTRVPAGVVLTCPRCGMRFTLGPPAPTAPTPPAPPGYPPTGSTPPYPPAPGSPPAPPPGYPPAPAPPATDFDDMSAAPAGPQEGDRALRVRVPSSPVESSTLQTAVLVVMGLALMGGVGLMVYFRLADKPRKGGGDSVSQLRDFNLSFEPPPSPWVQDEDMRVKLGPPVILAYKQPEPEAYIAYGARDYETKSPRPSELRAGLMDPLNRLFEDIRPTELADARWLGQPAIAFTFHARYKDAGATVDGVCYATSYKGIAYWALFWAGENDAGKTVEAFESARARLKLGAGREKWESKGTGVKSYRGHALGYEVLDADGIWSVPDEAIRPPVGEDPKGDLLLAAKVKQRGRDFPHEATLLVMILDSAGGDPLAEGRKYVEDQWTAEVKKGGETLTPKFTERTGAPEGDPPGDGVEETAPVVRLRADVGGARSLSRLMAISAIKIDGKVAVAWAWCTWDECEVFEARLKQIVGSLRPAS